MLIPQLCFKYQIDFGSLTRAAHENEGQEVSDRFFLDGYYKMNEQLHDGCHHHEEESDDEEDHRGTDCMACKRMKLRERSDKV